MFPLGDTSLWHGGYVTAHASTSKRTATTPSILTFELSSNLGLARSAEAGLAFVGTDGGSDGDAPRERRVLRAVARDDVARARDLAALARDEAARTRDREMGTHNAIRRAAAEDRAAAAADREAAARDRADAARDREDAARDRLGAQKICDALLGELAIAETDQLTGARTRAAGLRDIDHEIARAQDARSARCRVCRRRRSQDRQRYARSRRWRRATSTCGARRLRPYDLIVRLGGDEFLCAMPGATIQEARQRFGTIQDALGSDPDPSELKYGFAELGHADTTADLIGRADAELPISAPR